MLRKPLQLIVIAAALWRAGITAHADETCHSPYITALIKGHEDFVHAWTLGVKGLGDGNDKLVTVDANPKSAQYGQGHTQGGAAWAR